MRFKIYLNNFHGMKIHADNLNFRFLHQGSFEFRSPTLTARSLEKLEFVIVAQTFSYGGWYKKVLQVVYKLSLHSRRWGKSHQAK